MRVIVSIALSLSLLGCSSRDSAGGNTPEVADKPAPAAPSADVPASQAFHVDEAALGLEPMAAGVYRDDSDGGIKSLHLFERRSDGMGLQIHVVHGARETGTPAGVLLKHAKMYHTQIAPSLPFPKVTVSADKTLAFCTTLNNLTDTDIQLSGAWRRVEGVSGVVMVEGVQLGTPRLTEAEIAHLDDLVRKVATGLTVR